MTPLRARLFYPPNAVPDTGITMRNGWPIRKPCEVIKLPPPPPIVWTPPANKIPVCSHKSNGIASFSIRKIRVAFCWAWGVSEIDMVSARRDKAIVVPRQAAIALCRRLTRHSLLQIGYSFGNRDHTTVLHAIRKMHPHIEAVAAEIIADAPVIEWARAMKLRLSP